MTLKPETIAAQKEVKKLTGIIQHLGACLMLDPDTPVEQLAEEVRVALIVALRFEQVRIAIAKEWKRRT